jgi:hypothetical protein
MYFRIGYRNLPNQTKFIRKNEIYRNQLNWFIFFNWSKFNLECVGDSVTHYFTCIFVIMVACTRISQNTGTKSNKCIETNHFLSLRILVHLSVCITLLFFFPPFISILFRKADFGKSDNTNSSVPRFFVLHGHSVNPHRINHNYYTVRVKCSLLPNSNL